MLENKCRSLQEIVNTQANTIEQQNKRPDLALTALRKTFNADQVDVLLYEKQRPKEWSNSTITESLKTKFVCGKKGYEHERQKYPMPTQRTLQKRMENISFGQEFFMMFWSYLDLNSTLCMKLTWTAALCFTKCLSRKFDHTVSHLGTFTVT